jgi:meiotically up-regulated gene 157 (Mug157) protein
MEMMINIASDHDRSKEMMEAIMQADHGKMLMHERMKTRWRTRS